MSEPSPGPRGEHLLLLTHQYPFDSGDAAFVRDEISALAAAFERISIISLTAPPSAMLPLPTNVRYLGATGTISFSRAVRGLIRPSRAFRALRTFAKEGRTRSLREMQKDLVAVASGAWFASRAIVKTLLGGDESLTVYSFWGVDIAYLLPWLRQRARRMVVRVHRYDIDMETAGYRPLRRAILHDTDLVLTISENAREYLLARHPFIRPEGVAVRRLGIPEQVASPAVAGTDDELQVVSCSSVIPLKRVALILESVTALAERGRRIRWTHFGDGPLFEDLRRAVVARTDRSPNLHVELVGRVPRDQVLAFYRKSHVDAFINVSTIEGVPVSAMEAAAFGIPIVATDVGSTRELVGESLRSGVLIAVDEGPEAIADALAHVADHSDELDPRGVWADRFDAAQNSSATARSVLGSGIAESR